MTTPEPGQADGQILEPLHGLHDYRHRWRLLSVWLSTFVKVSLVVVVVSFPNVDGKDRVVSMNTHLSFRFLFRDSSRKSRFRHFFPGHS
jgi:hypothetical protein